MDPKYSLEYYAEIFNENPLSFMNLLSELIVMLDQYPKELETVLFTRDETRLKELRHKYLPLVENLNILDLKELEERLKQDIKKLSKNELQEILNRIKICCIQVTKKLILEKEKLSILLPH